MPDFGHARPRSGGRHSLPAALALLLASVVGVVAPNPRDPRLLNPIVQDSVFVKWRQSSATAGSATLAAAAGAGDVVKLASGGAVSAAPVRPSEQPANTVARLKNLPGVEAIGYDFWVHAQGSSEHPSFPYMAPYTDTYWNESWGMHRISAGYAWGRGVAGRKGDGAPRVCLIDSGVDCDHPDLKDVCAAGKSFFTDGRRTTQRSGLKAVRDESGHGTMMAGLIAATKNHMGSVGALYNGVALHVCKFMDANGFGRMIDARLCLDWCLKQRTHISVAAWGVNIYAMKWRCNDTLAAELRRRGREAEAEEWRCDDPASALLWEFKSQLEGAAGWHVMVAAAGNDGRRLLADCPSYAWMPSQMRASNMLVVTASDYYDRLWRAGGAGPPQHATCDAMRQGTPAGGNYGADWVHIAAPGQEVWTTRMRTKEELKDKKLRARGTYLQVSGTSAAAALVAGGLGLFQVATGNDASGLMAEMLLAGADAVPQLAADAGDGGGPPVAGGRRLNVFNPLVAVAELFGYQSWQWLPPQLCGLAPESTLPPLTAQPPPPDPSGVGNLNKGPDAPPPPQQPPPPTPPQPPDPRPPPPKPRPPPPLPKPRPPPPKPRPPPPLPKPSPPPPKPRPPPPKPRPSPPPPKPRPPPPKPRPPPPKPRPPPPQAVPRPPKPAPRPPPPGCQATYYWNGRACVACASRWGSNCALCTGSRCTLSCPPSARSRLPCSQYYPAPARRG